VLEKLPLFRSSQELLLHSPDSSIGKPPTSSQLCEQATSMNIHWAPGEADERDLLQVLQCFDEQNYAVQREDFSGQLLRVKLSDRQQQNSEIFAGAF
jgi:hypothetical protein